MVERRRLQNTDTTPEPDGIVPDKVWPGMYRLRTNGVLSDMVNLTRAKQALKAKHDD